MRLVKTGHVVIKVLMIMCVMTSEKGARRKGCDD